MKAKDYLKQLEDLNIVINNKMVEKTRWRDVALGVTAHSDGDRVQSSGSKQKMADAVDKWVDVDRQINNMVDRMIDLQQEIIFTIEQLNATEYDVLHKRYIQNMTFEEIGAAKGKSKSWATTIHGRALQNVQHILDERDAENEKKHDSFERVYLGKFHFVDENL